MSTTNDSLPSPNDSKFHPDFDKPAGPGTIILESKDNVLFYTRLPLLAEVSTVFRDMQQVGSNTATTVKHERSEYPRIPLDTASAAGIAVVLTVIRNTLAGVAPMPLHVPKEAYIEALEIAQLYDIPLVRAAIPHMALHAYQGHPFGFLALLVVCQDKEAMKKEARRAIRTDFAPDMPDWVRQTIRRHDPDFLLSVMEMQARLEACRTAIWQGAAYARTVADRTWCPRKRCEANMQELIAQTVDRLQTFATECNLDSSLSNGDSFIETNCQQCRIEVRRVLQDAIQTYERRRTAVRDSVVYGW